MIVKIMDARRGTQNRINRNFTSAEGHGDSLFPKHEMVIRMHSKRVFLLSRHL